MRQDKFSRQNILLYCLGTIPVTWLALLIAPYMEDGLAGLIWNFGPAMENPFHVARPHKTAPKKSAEKEL